MDPVMILMIMFVLSIFLLALSLYVTLFNQSKQEDEDTPMSRQTFYFDQLDALAKDKEKTKEERITEVYLLADESAKDITLDEVDVRMAKIKKHYYNNVFKEQLKKSFYAVPHLFRISSVRIFMEDMAELNDDKEAGQMAELLLEFESITSMIYERTHDWDSPEVIDHLIAIEKHFPD